MRPQSRVSHEIKRIKKASAGSTGQKRVRKKKATFEPRTLDEARTIWEGWFIDNGWQPFEFQQKAWSSFLEGKSGLISVPTGSGKTYAALGGPLMDLIANPGEGLKILYVSPLKALARDLMVSIQKPLQELGLPFTVELRTGDTSAATRAKLREQLPQILVITPESLALMMTEVGWRERLGGLRAIVLDEWHELLGSKRGSLLELTLAHLRAHAPDARTWALSATIANLEFAAQVAVGNSQKSELIRQNLDRPIEVHSLLPESVAKMPWFGYSGLRLMDTVIANIDPDQSTLLFTNTRSQAERWYQELSAAKPEWREEMALHHGSLDRAERERVEGGIKDGSLKLVVATSSLDLGVDFPQVEKVIQIGSTKGLARALQRAGRAFHRPGQSTQLWICPTNLLEVVEISALREGLKQGVVEERRPLKKPMDVFVQFLLNCAYEDGFTRDEIMKSARSTISFEELTDVELDWAIKFVTEGGYSLSAYPQFRKLALIDGRYKFAERRLAMYHKMNMGTILSDSGLIVKFPRGQSLGTIEESFISRLRPGDVFYFAGRTLKLIHVRDMTAYVRLGQAKDALTPVWTGTSFPISPRLSAFLRLEFQKLNASDEPLSPELKAFQPAARLQNRLSQIPGADEILVELWKAKDGYHLFVFTFEGRLVHEGLGHLAAFRLARLKRNTFSVSANDHGFELLSTELPGSADDIRRVLTDIEGIGDDVAASLNYPELAKRGFREIARVAGLLHQGYPGQQKAMRHLQMSSSLLFDVFQRYEPEHPLLQQAFREVRERQLELNRLKTLMQEMAFKKWIFKEVDQATPFAFPLLIERMRSTLSTETLEDRIARMAKQWEVTPS